MKVSVPIAFLMAVAASAHADSFSAEDQAIWIDRHNYFRTTGLPWSAGDMRRIGWRADLATTAASTASACSATTAAGVNVYQSAASNSSSIIDEAIQNWVVETSMTTLKTLPQPGSVGVDVGTGVYNSYSQMLWASTTSVGCATASCSGGDMVVCNYSPAGNDGSSPWYVHADTASDCPAGTTAATGLCIVEGDAANDQIAAIPAGKLSYEVYPAYVADMQTVLIEAARAIASGSTTGTIGSTADQTAATTAPTATTAAPNAATTAPTAATTAPTAATTAPTATTAAPTATTATPTISTSSESSSSSSSGSETSSKQTTTTSSSSDTSPSSDSTATKSSKSTASSDSYADTSTATKTSKTATSTSSNLDSSTATKSSKKTKTTTSSSSTDSSYSDASTKQTSDESAPGTVKASSDSGSTFTNQASTTTESPTVHTSSSTTTAGAPSTANTESTTASSGTGASTSINNQSSTKSSDGISAAGLAGMIVLAIVGVAAFGVVMSYKRNQRRQREIMRDGGIRII